MSRVGETALTPDPLSQSWETRSGVRATRYNACRPPGARAISNAIKLLTNLLILSGLLMAVLGILRVGFARRFWTKMQWVAFTYIAIILMLAAVRTLGWV